MIIPYLNINSIKNKFGNFSTLTFNFFAIAETEIDAYFPSNQFELEGYKVPYRHDKTSRSGDFYSFDRIIIIDFNTEPSDRDLLSFMENHSLFNHMHKKTCWKSSILIDDGHSSLF